MVKKDRKSQKKLNRKNESEHKRNIYFKYP